MRKLLFLFFCVVLYSGRVYPQQSLLKFFEGQWEGTLQYFNPKGEEIGKYKAKRALSFVSADTLRGTLEYLYLQNKTHKTNIEIIEKRNGFLLRQAHAFLEGSYKDRNFTFYGRDDSLNVEISESHFFIGGDQEFFTIEHIDPQTKKKSVFMRGVLKLKKK